MSDQGKTYGAFIDAELKADRDRRTAFDARGVSLVTTSGGLVTLLTAVVAFFRVGRDYEFPKSALGPLVFALVSLTAAAAAGILASWNRLYGVPKPATLDKLLNDRWALDTEVAARNFVGTMQVLTISSLREGNNWKARWVSIGLVSQVVALLALSVVVYMLLRAYA